MTSLQLCFLLFTFGTPPLLWVVGRRYGRPSYDRAVARGLASLLILTYLADLVFKFRDGQFIPAVALPMQLCDWTLFAVVAALWFDWRTGFELGYFWGLGGTIQALFTPAIEASVGFIRLFGFFLAHSLIVVAVIYLMLARGLRPHPASLIRVIIASEIFLAAALTVNAYTGANYGFLTHRPSTPTLLDLFSDVRWIYILQLNLTALVIYGLCYAPWLIVDLRRRSRAAREGLT